MIILQVCKVYFSSLGGHSLCVQSRKLGKVTCWIPALRCEELLLLIFLERTFADISRNSPVTELSFWQCSHAVLLLLLFHSLMPQGGCSLGHPAVLGMWG